MARTGRVFPAKAIIKRAGLVATSTVEASAGTGAATWVGRSTNAQRWTAAGTGAATWVGRSTFSAVWSSSGTGTLTALNNGTSAAVWASAGTGALTATGRSTAASALSSTGTGTFTATGRATKAAVAGSISGTGTATWVGRSTSAAVWSASGTSQVLLRAPQAGGTVVGNPTALGGWKTMHTGPLPSLGGILNYGIAVIGKGYGYYRRYYRSGYIDPNYGSVGTSPSVVY